MLWITHLIIKMTLIFAYLYFKFEYVTLHVFTLSYTNLCNKFYNDQKWCAIWVTLEETFAFKKRCTGWAVLRRKNVQSKNKDQ